MPDDMPFDCWDTYRNEDGVVYAINKWWPSMRKDAVVAHALAQIDMAERAIDSVMQQKHKESRCG